MIRSSQVVRNTHSRTRPSLRECWQIHVVLSWLEIDLSTQKATETLEAVKAGDSAGFMAKLVDLPRSGSSRSSKAPMSQLHH